MWEEEGRGVGNVLNRADLAEPRMGPCIVEEYDATCIVPPSATASLDRFGNIAIDMPPAEPGKGSSGGEKCDAS